LLGTAESDLPLSRGHGTSTVAGTVSDGRHPPPSLDRERYMPCGLLVRVVDADSVAYRSLGDMPLRSLDMSFPDSVDLAIEQEILPPLPGSENRKKKGVIDRL